MKKTLLYFGLMLPMFVFAQTTTSKKYEVRTASEKATTATDNGSDDAKTYSSTTTESSNEVVRQSKTQNYAAVKIGETFYDLQTNNSVGRRIILHPDGKISAVWTTSPTATPNWPSRGSGYAHNNGTSWSSVTKDRLESNNRTGWPSIGVIDGKEFVISHESTTGGFGVSMNEGIGNGNWTTDVMFDDTTVVNVNRVPIWGRAAANGDVIHLISNYWVNEDGDVPLVTINGVNSPTTYSRYNVKTKEFEEFHMILPGYDSTKLSNGGGDSYAIDVRGDVVAIAIAGVLHPAFVWKSTDAGKTWTFNDADAFPYYGDARNDIVGDTAWSNDGSVDVMIDDNDMVHTFFGGLFVTDSDTTDESYSYFPYNGGIFHWSEATDMTTRCGALIDADGNQAIDINPETIASLDADGELTANNDGSFPTFAARYGSTGLLTHPSATMDKDGNMYVTYSAPIEFDLHPRQANFRDILVSYSTDGGATWNGPQNITQRRNWEDVFGCLPKRVDGFLNMVYQTDKIPGTHLQNDGAQGLHPNDVSDIMYVAVPLEDIRNNVLGQNTLSSEEVYTEGNVFVVSQNYPNPFSSETEVIIYLQKNSDVTLTVTDVLGNVVSETSNGDMSKGNHALKIDGSALTSGIYFYTITAGANQVTRKMQVK